MYLLFRLTKDEEKDSSLQKGNSVEDISIQNFVILEHDEKQYLAQVFEINQAQQEITVQYYKPSFPLSSDIRLFSKMENKLNIDCQNIIASFIVPLASNR